MAECSDGVYTQAMTKQNFWTVLALGLAIGFIIGWVAGHNVAENTIVIPLGEGLKT